MSDYKNQIEAILFASGSFVDVDTLQDITEASNKQVIKKNVKKLKQEYEERNSPIMVVEEGNGWKLTVREAYLPLVRNIVSETELPKSVLETLAIIAWQAPVLQSEVINIRHNKAYTHIALLEDLGFIRKDSEGRSYRLYLTEKFYEYFDVAGSKDIRKVFKKVVEKPGQMKVEDFEAQVYGKEDKASSKERNEEDEEGDEEEQHDDEFTELDDVDEKGEKESVELEEIDEEDEEFTEL